MPPAISGSNNIVIDDDNDGVNDALIVNHSFVATYNGDHTIKYSLIGGKKKTVPIVSTKLYVMKGTDWVLCGRMAHTPKNSLMQIESNLGALVILLLKTSQELRTRQQTLMYL
jgi:hypothetical protein